MQVKREWVEKTFAGANGAWPTTDTVQPNHCWLLLSVCLSFCLSVCLMFGRLVGLDFVALIVVNVYSVDFFFLFYILIYMYIHVDCTWPFVLCWLIGMFWYVTHVHLCRFLSTYVGPLACEYFCISWCVFALFVCLLY